MQQAEALSRRKQRAEALSRIGFIQLIRHAIEVEDQVAVLGWQLEDLVEACDNRVPGDGGVDTRDARDMLAWVKRRWRWPRMPMREPDPMDVIAVNYKGHRRLFAVTSVEWPSGHTELEPLDLVLARSILVDGEEWISMHDLLLEQGWQPPPDARL